VVDTKGLCVDEGLHAGIARQGHAHGAGAVVRALARDHRAPRQVAGQAGDLDRVLVGIGTPQREEHAPALQARDGKQFLGQLGADLRAPLVGDEAQRLCLLLYRRHQPGMLMAQQAALGE